MKQHPIYTHLFITEDGRIYSDKSKKFLALFKHKSGRMVFSTRLNGRNSPAVCFKVHRLVAETYLDNPNNLPQVNHIDGDPINNKVTNLEWCTASHNIKHAYRLGLMSTEKKYNPAFSHSEEDIELAKLYRADGLSLRAIADLFGVSHPAIMRWLTW